MAITQVSQGVYLVSPASVGTAGQKYTQLFTKNREEQWQLSLKQAEMDLKLGLASYEQESEFYKARVKALNDRAKNLDTLISKAQEGRLDAADTAALQFQKQTDERQKMQAEQTTLTSRTSESTGGTGGGGSRAGRTAGSVSDTEKEKIGTAVGGKTTAEAAEGLTAARKAGGLTPASPADADAQDYAAVQDLARNRAAATGKDQATAELEILDELEKTGHPDISEGAKRHGGRLAADTAPPEAGTPSRTKSKTVERQVPKYRGLTAEPPPLTPVTPVSEMARPQDEKFLTRGQAIDKLLAERAAIESEIKGLERPGAPSFDLITRAREVAAGRFGPTYAAPAFRQRNALQALMNADPQMRELVLTEYRKTLPPVPAQVAGAPGISGTAGLPEAPTTDAGWESVGVVRPETGDKAKDDAAYQAAKDEWFKKTYPPEAVTLFTSTEPEFQMEPGLGVAGLINKGVEMGAAAATPGLDPAAAAELKRQSEAAFAAAEKLSAEESKIGADIAAAERPFEIPFEERGGETVPFFRRPGGPADQRALDEYLAGKRDIRARQAPPEGTYPTATEPTPVAPVATEAAPPVAPPPAAPVVPGVTAPSAVGAPAPAPAPPVAPMAPGGSAPVAPPQIRPEAAALMTPEERQKMEEELMALVAKRTRERVMAEEARRTGLLQEQMPTGAPLPSVAGLRPPSTARPGVSFRDIPSFAGPGGTPSVQPSIAPVTSQLLVMPPGRMAPPPDIGVKEEGAIPQIEADIESRLAPRNERAAMLEKETPEQLRGTISERAEQMRTGATPATQRAEITADAAERLQDIKAAGAMESFRGPKPQKRETKEDYLFGRLQEAYTLSKKIDKLDRLIASGAGKVAYDLYVGNKATGKPFSKTYEEITMTFSGDRSAMEQAHAVALALDMKDSDKLPGGK